MKPVFMSLGISLMLTWLLESIAYLFVKKKTLRDYLVLLLVNLVTNPVVVLISVCTSFSGMTDILLTVVLEASAVLIEWQLYKRCAQYIPRPLCFALCANLFSYFTGQILQLL
ncbi:MAG: hypothetical protein E7523_09980 [Ruminococcaceae bacterium]|nr:hypothetical protein [Oscillospiraceae bacterium]